MTRLFLGEDGKLRHIWRALSFSALVFWLLPYGADPLTALVFNALHLKPTLSPGLVALVEGEYFLTALVATIPFAIYERRSVFSYGLTLSRAFSLPTLEGIAVGAVMAVAVAAGMIALGGMQVHGLAIAGSALGMAALAWLGTNICVGISEEFWFRSYLLQSLWRSIGFWPASLVIAAGFAAIHYFSKPGENIWDVITLVWFSLLLCLSVLRIGTLWFAVGLHAAFDYMQLFVIGTPNGGQRPEGHLLDATFNGPAWLTGGTLGTEASFLMYPMLALATLYVWLRYRPAAATTAEPPKP
jgi:membrane protease YdiL (CAAX protease family)